MFRYQLVVKYRELTYNIIIVSIICFHILDGLSIVQDQGLTGRLFQLRVGSGLGIGKNYRVGSGLGSGSGIGNIY